MTVPASDLEARVARLRGALGREPASVVVSPYRICPIGAHSDHQRGPVLGMAISAYTLLAFAPGEGAELRVTSEDFPGETRVDLRRPRAAPAGDWGAYARAAACALRERLPRVPRGVVARASGTLPGGGLSSSASVLLAYLTALARVNGLELDARELVALSRRAENAYVGVASGILDPASIVAARRERLIEIDTARERWRAVALGPGAPEHRILVAFTGTARNLAATRFNERVAECHAAAARLGELSGRGGVTHLGDLPDDAFAEWGGKLAPALRNRARHFFGERGRVREGVEAWSRGDLARFGELMAASCRSSIESYETGSREQIALQEILLASPGVFGARFSGAGFGGCSVALVAADAAEDCRERVARAFGAAFPALAERQRAFLVESEDGVRVL